MYKSIAFYIFLAISFIFNFVYIFRPGFVLSNQNWIRYDILPTIILLSLVPVIIIFLSYLLSPKLHKYEKFNLRVFIISGIIVVLSNIFFSYQEKSHFPNFVYSTYKIYLPALNNFSQIYFFGLLLTIVKLSSWERYLKEYIKKNEKYIFRSVISVSILILFVHTLFGLPHNLFSEVIKTRNYFAKFTPMIEMPKLSQQLEFVVEHTNPNSTIVHPDQSAENPELGNQVLIRYMLYPRQLVAMSSYKVNNNDFNLNNTFFISTVPLDINSNHYVKYASDKSKYIYIYQLYEK